MRPAPRGANDSPARLNSSSRSSSSSSSRSRPGAKAARTSTMYYRSSRSALLLAVLLPAQVAALFHVPGSPCASVCADQIAGTLHDDVRCLEPEYSTGPGRALKDCVTCQLNSTAVEPSTSVSDVEWALFNLRYTLSNCMFAYPEERVSISSPCQVTCAPLQTAVTTGISNTTNQTSFTPDLNYCQAAKFDDTTINNCAFCYSFIPQQLFLGNFLQSLHIACHSPPEDGKVFYPDGAAIFTNITIAGPSNQTSSDTVSAGLSGSSLILAIVLPIVGGILILAVICCTCWHFTRKRRHEMAASGRMSKFHDGQASLYSPVARGMPGQPQWHEPPTEMTRVSMTPKSSSIGSSSKRPSPGIAQGRWAHQEDDGAGVPLNSADRQTFAISNAGLGIEQRTRQDSDLHEQYIGVADGGADPHAATAWRAPDEYGHQHRA